MTASLRARIIRLAHKDPVARPHLLLVLREASVKVDTEKHELRNVVKVTDSAYGNWTFEMGDPARGEPFTVRSSPFRDARRQAVAEAQRRGVDVIILQP